MWEKIKEESREGSQRLAFRLPVISVAATRMFQNAIVGPTASCSGMRFPQTVNGGDPVLHERASEVSPREMTQEKVKNIIEDMVHVMRRKPALSLTAPEIGIPLRVIMNPKIKKTSNKIAFFLERCTSIDGFGAVVERYLDIEVIGFNQYGEPIKISANGWKARVLQHACDHLDGILFVDQIVPKTFRSLSNCDLPFARGCPKLGPR